jgi:hypothetical protein
MRSFVALARWLAAGLALLGTSSLAAQSPSHPDVVGTWNMDTTKFAKHDAALAALTLNVTHHGDTLVIVTDVLDVGRPPFTMTTRYLPEEDDGGAAPGRTAVQHLSRLSWRGDTLVLNTVETRPERTLKIEEQWVIDASGKTLSRLQTVVDGPRVSRQTLVFTRQ